MISSNNALVESGTLRTWFCPKFLGNKYGNAKGDCGRIRTFRRSDGDDAALLAVTVVGCAEGEGWVVDGRVGAGENLAADAVRGFSREGSGGISGC